MRTYVQVVAGKSRPGVASWQGFVTVSVVRSMHRSSAKASAAKIKGEMTACSLISQLSGRSGQPLDYFVALREKHMNATVMTIAMYYALKEVMAVILRQQGRSALREMEKAELTRLAAAYLDSHPEIIEQAARTLRNEAERRRMAQRLRSGPSRRQRHTLTCWSNRFDTMPSAPSYVRRPVTLVRENDQMERAVAGFAGRIECLNPYALIAFKGFEETQARTAAQRHHKIIS
jgi:hypothetical protein